MIIVNISVFQCSIQHSRWYSWKANTNDEYFSSNRIISNVILLFKTHIAL